MPEQTKGLFIKGGTINNKQKYVGQNNTSYTLDIAVLGLRQMIPVRVSAEMFDKLKEGDSFDGKVAYSVNKYGPSFTLG